MLKCEIKKTAETHPFDYFLMFSEGISEGFQTGAKENPFLLILEQKHKYQDIYSQHLFTISLLKSGFKSAVSISLSVNKMSDHHNTL